MFKFGKGKPRSKVGKLIDKHGYTQENLVKASGVSRNTVSKVCSDPKYVPSPSVLKKIMKTIRSIEPGAKADDYFDI
ncbi:helix-turn-helix transcriptional regulator [Peribacillus loiseleuriae]|uniref:XRE family transcriptional regulator n=1 Tax=Peribacillus loiseleuriae TaxID=1679170 RepID=A0A0K9G4Y4_9BACI|nr:helix-turn-helix transcriptional regulator [Peribacillus loiseleuriae]KMY41476.1 XRE family transcriptional regulator [Peribacillus loiseleuriae]